MNTETKPNTNMVRTIFMWPNGGTSEKIIDFVDLAQVKRFAKLANYCYRHNGVVICQGVNDIPDVGHKELHKRLGLIPEENG